MTRQWKRWRRLWTIFSRCHVPEVSPLPGAKKSWCNGHLRRMKTKARRFGMLPKMPKYRQHGTSAKTPLVAKKSFLCNKEWKESWWNFCELKSDTQGAWKSSCHRDGILLVNTHFLGDTDFISGERIRYCRSLGETWAVTPLSRPNLK